MSAADDIRANHPDAVARGEAKARAAMEATDRIFTPRPPEPEPTMEDEDIPDWVRAYGPRKQT